MHRHVVLIRDVISTSRIPIKIKSHDSCQTSNPQKIYITNNYTKMACDLEKICEILDKLTLDSLTLMEQEIQQKLELEKCMCDGESQLAKSRYIMGRNSVSALQLPSTDNIVASAIVRREDNDNLYTDEVLELEVKKKPEESTNPIRWFGVLVPQNLYDVQNKFKQALLWAVKAANTQCQLRAVCVKIAQLEELKERIVAGE